MGSPEGIRNFRSRSNFRYTPRFSQPDEQAKEKQKEEQEAESDGSESSGDSDAAESSASESSSSAESTDSNGLSLPPMRIHYGTCSAQGRRASNEDEALLLDTMPNDATTQCFAVFDGHGGRECAEFLKQSLAHIIAKQPSWPGNRPAALTAAFIEADQAFLDTGIECGSTAVLALIDEARHVWVANLGDSRCVKGSFGNDLCEPLTKDHKPGDPEEVARVKSSGHIVIGENHFINGKRLHIDRIDGIIAVSRAFGDPGFKAEQELPERRAISCVPVITESILNENEFLLLACDGVWDVLSNEEAIRFVCYKMRGSMLGAISPSLALTSVAEDLVRETLRRGSTDNVTVILVQLS
jgi:serine/threonine protein phosphatase PrpC